jgi:protein SEY1
MIATRRDTAHQAVYKRKRADIIRILDSTSSPLFLGKLKNIHRAVLVSFKVETVASLKVDVSNFADAISKARAGGAGAATRFSGDAREAVVVEGDAAWQWEEELRLLRDEIQSVADRLRYVTGSPNNR